MILGIDWNVSAELIDGWATPNKYGLLFVTGLILGFIVTRKMFKNEGVPERILDSLLVYVILATIIGARLGHVFFYDWDYYKNHLSDIIKVWEGGLASHGAAIAILIALFIFSKKVSKKPYLWILDRIAAPIAIAGTFIRLGNLVNHEIIGNPTDLPWGFRFNLSGDEFLINGEHVFRHPTQLYEAICYLLTFALLMYLYWKTNAKNKPGVLFGTFMIVLWTVRLLVEFVKEGQTARDFESVLNTGQMLSIPFIIAGIGILYFGLKSEPKIETFSE
jgi:prolipoprotein diacylglyceryl transferase